MPGLEDLYREIILDHYRTPRNRGELAPPAVKAEGFNPLCGDEITVYLDVTNGVITAISPTTLKAKRIIDAKNHVVSPGFIDLHVHRQNDENNRYKARDGVTTSLELEIGVSPMKKWIDERRGGRFGRGRPGRGIPQAVGQRFQSPFAGRGGTRLLLGFVGQVQVFQALQRIGRFTGIPLLKLTELVHEFAVEQRPMMAQQIKTVLLWKNGEVVRGMAFGFIDDQLQFIYDNHEAMRDWYADK